MTALAPAPVDVGAFDNAEEIPELSFSAGLPGFPEARRFALSNWGGEQSPFALLSNLDDPDLAFVVVPPQLFFPTYEPEIDDATCERLGLRSADDALILVVVTVGDRPADATANLLGPIVINRHTHQGAQAVLASSGYEVRTPLV